MRGRRLAWVLLVGLAASGGVVCGSAPQPAFDGARAFADLVDQVRIGPRPAGSEGAARTRALISDRLRQAGWRVERHAFTVAGPDGASVDMENVIGVQRGRSDRLLVLGAHYDTKHIAGTRFVGANDGASGVALLLELARVLGDGERRFTTLLVFFDGEEAFGPSITRTDGLYGSRALAKRMQSEGSLERIHAFVLVDMIADRDLNLSTDRTSSAELRALLAEVAADLGLGDVLDPTATLSLVDDHTPFLERGVEPVLALIDFQFGARHMPGPFWHTERDDLEAVSEESLNRVGKLVVELVGRIENDVR